MTPYQFWHEDVGLLEAYYKAYANGTAFSAYIFGARVYEAVSKSLNNAFAKDKSEMQPYDSKEPDIIKAYNEEKSVKHKRENEQAAFEKYQQQTNAWI